MPKNGLKWVERSKEEFLRVCQNTSKKYRKTKLKRFGKKKCKKVINVKLLQNLIMV